jgi:hypothetical protein
MSMKKQTNFAVKYASCEAVSSTYGTAHSMKERNTCANKAMNIGIAS